MTRARKWLQDRAAYLLALLPVLTDWIDTGHWPQHLNELATEVVIGGLILVGVFLLYRRGDRFKHLAETDALTGLGNRLNFEADLEAAVERAHQSGQALALAFIDVDDFKQINDRFGHLAGDDVLREVGLVLRHSVRQGVDRCYRIGGDEFAVLLTTMDAPTAVGALRRAFARASAKLAEHEISCSVGVIALGEADGPADFVKRADELMYAAKFGKVVEVRAGAVSSKVSRLAQPRTPRVRLAGALAVGLLALPATTWASPSAEVPVEAPELARPVVDAPALLPRSPEQPPVNARLWEVAPAPAPKVLPPEGGVVLFRF